MGAARLPSAAPFEIESRVTDFPSDVRMVSSPFTCPVVTEAGALLTETTAIELEFCGVGDDEDNTGARPGPAGVWLGCCVGGVGVGFQINGLEKDDAFVL